MAYNDNMQKHTLNVSLTAELEQQVQAFVQSGMYGNQSEVVRAGLRLLLEREQERTAKLAALRSAIGLGVEQMLAGEVSGLSLGDVEIRSQQRLQGKP